MTTSRQDEYAALGRQMAAAQGITDDRPPAAWIAYGQACADALAHRRPVPLPLPLPPVTPPPSRSTPLRYAAVPPPAPPALPPASAGTLCPGCDGHGDDADEPSSPLGRFAARVTWGLAWRYAILLAVVVYAGGHAGAPRLVIAGVVVAGLLLGLWHRGWVLARVWRTLVVAGTAVYVAPLLPVYPAVVAGSVGALTLAPFVSSMRRRRW